MNVITDIKKLETTWLAFEDAAHIKFDNPDAEYDNLVFLMDTLIDTVGDNEQHPLASLLYFVGESVRGIEQAQMKIEATKPSEVLQHLMDERGLTQSDLKGLVPQGNLSRILSGDRNVSLSLAKKFSEFFGVSKTVFLV